MASAEGNAHEVALVEGLLVRIKKCDDKNFPSKDSVHLLWMMEDLETLTKIDGTTIKPVGPVLIGPPPPPVLTDTVDDITSEHIVLGLSWKVPNMAVTLKFDPNSQTCF